MQAPDTKFKGTDYNPKRDKKRLSTQMQAVYDVMSDQQWHSIAEVQDAIVANTGKRYLDGSISRAIRHFRDSEYGDTQVFKQNVGGGLFLYKIEISAPDKQLGLF